MKKISIITINYNNKNGLQKTIKSVIGQIYSFFEFIVIDGGSTDGSVEVIEEYRDKIDYWISEKDNGIYNAMNKGIRHASGDYLNFMNSGDCFHDNKVLEHILPYLDKDIVVGKYLKNNQSVAWGFPKKEVTMADLYRGTLNHQATFFSSSLFQNGLYDERFSIVSDWKFYIEQLVFHNCSFRNVDILVVDYDVNGISASSVTYFKERDKVIDEMIPYRILEDYRRFAWADSPIIDLLPEFNRSGWFHRFMFHHIKHLVAIYKFLQRYKVTRKLFRLTENSSLV